MIYSRPRPNIRSTFENAIEGIFQSTPGGRYLSVNPAMARIYGYETPEEMIAAVTAIARQVYADPEMRGEFARRLNKEGKIEKFERREQRCWMSFVRPDGMVAWVKGQAMACINNLVLCFLIGKQKYPYLPSARHYFEAHPADALTLITRY